MTDRRVQKVKNALNKEIAHNQRRDELKKLKRFWKEFSEIDIQNLSQVESFTDARVLEKIRFLKGRVLEIPSAVYEPDSDRPGNMVNGLVDSLVKVKLVNSQMPMRLQFIANSASEEGLKLELDGTREFYDETPLATLILLSALEPLRWFLKEGSALNLTTRSVETYPMRLMIDHPKCDFMFNLVLSTRRKEEIIYALEIVLDELDETNAEDAVTIEKIHKKLEDLYNPKKKA